MNRVGFCDIEVGYDVHVVGDLAYSTNNDGLMIINVSNPRVPVKIGEALIGGSFGFVVENNIAYIASVINGFTIVNISDPVDPDVLCQSTTEVGITRITVSGSLAYASYYNGGLKIFNISDPSTPIFLGEYSSTRSDAVEIKDNYVYLANAEVGLKVINVSNPNIPELITSISQTGGGNDIYISEEILFLACWGSGIRVIDISNPTAPQMLDSYDDNDGGEELGLIEKDDLLYVADNYGVELFNVSNPNSIVEITQRTSDVIAAHDIDVDEDYIYVAQGGGLLILEVSTISDNTTPNILPYIIIISIVAVAAGISILIYFRFIKK
ncbi:MAG: LVIVD repeat-containing protein [Promethearchaeota archaeon]